MNRCNLVMVCVAVASSMLSAQDINLDGRVDCADTELLGDAILAGDSDSRFDLDSNGIVEMADHFVWRNAVPFDHEDVTLDGQIDQRDILVFALNFGHDHPYGVCRGDITLDGRSDRVDNDINGYNPAVPFAASPSIATDIPDLLSVWNSAEVVFASSDKFHLVAVPEHAPDGLLATKVVVRTKDPHDLIGLFHNVSFTGDLHQVGLDFFFAPSHGSPNGVTPIPMIDEATIAQLNRVDSRMLQERWFYGKGDLRFGDSTDKSNPADLPDVIVPGILIGPEMQPLTFDFGLGSLGMIYPDFSSVALLSPFFGDIHEPDGMTRELEFAYLVTPAQMPESDQPGEVFVRLGVAGGSADFLPLSDFPVFGQDETLAIPFFAAPCDTDWDGSCDVEDLMRLEAAVGTVVPEFDLDQSATPIDTADVRVWFQWYETHNGITALPGDADLDRDVDAADLNRLGLAWMQSGRGWTGGDFDLDGISGPADLNVVGLNWQFGAVPAAIPEPPGGWQFGIPFLCFLKLLRKSLRPLSSVCRAELLLR